jgi:hypothetical protein
MAQMIGGGPLQETKLRDSIWAQPNAVLHLCCREALAPTTGARFRQIYERTYIRLKRLQLRVDLTATRWHKTCADTGAKVKIPSSIKADQDSIEAVRPRRITADHKLLGEFDAHLDP